MVESIAARSMELSDSGGHYYCADFQVHTPRDTQWSGSRPTNEREREVWADRLVTAAREKGLHAVAISDHHDFALYPYVKRAAQREVLASGEPLSDSARLVVFPALELSLTVPCQAILILDAEFPEEKLDDVLKALHFDPIDPALSMLPQTQNLDDSGDLNQLCEKLDKNQWLKARYILLPNVSPGGYRTLMRAQFQGKYKDMIPVGGYIDGSAEKFQDKNHVGTKRILDGEVPAWGSKRLALFQTSDSRSDDFSMLGAHTTWVKWSEPTAEAIRQACLAQESRIAHVVPTLPNAWISRIVVSQSKFMGRVDVSINPQYTALIGGRGTGKSTILDYLRWALCDQPASATEDDEVVDPRIRQRRLVDATLKPLDAFVEIHCVINGITHIVRRSAVDGTVQLKVGDGDYAKVRESAIQSLLPIQAYSQKQLSSVAIRADELLRFVTSPVQSELEEIERVQQEIAGRLRENYGSLERYRNLNVEIERTELRIRSLEEQAQSLRDGLGGLSDHDREVLNNKSGYDTSRSSVAEQLGQVDAVRSGLSELIGQVDESIDSLVRPLGVVPAEISAEVNSIHIASVSALKRLRAELSGGAQALNESLQADGAIGEASAEFERKIGTYEAEYADVKAQSSAHEAKLSELARLEELHQTSVALAQQQRRQRSVLGDPLVRHNELRHELIDNRKKKTAVLAAQCESLSESSRGAIRASLSSTRGFESVQSRFKAIIAGSNVRSNKIEGFFEQLALESDPPSTWEAVLAELEQLMMLEPDSDTNSELTPVLSRLGLSVADQKRIAPKLTPDGWLDLSLSELAVTPEFQYQSREGEYIPFSSASAGQQASALLGTLLSRSGMPLIIDQPEDDLDSDTVQQIVSEIWSSKSRRQLIFSSHNANLVVNGDADLVLVCAYVKSGDQSAGHIKEEGAIDMAPVRREITAVMEGGEKAFRLRKEKYGF